MSADGKLYSMLRRDAESSHSPAFAEFYRQEDEQGKAAVSHTGKCHIISEISRRFSKPIMMLDLGCGTGRYFHCAQNVRHLVGVDPSENMLVQARKPVTGAERSVQLIRSTLHEVAFLPGSFDLVICVGVLGEWCPLDAFVLKRVSEMLGHGGIFFCSVCEYQPAPLTWKRRIASAIRPLLFGAPARYVDFRLRQFTMDAEQVRALGLTYFEDVHITKWESPTTRVDLHCVMTQPRLLQTSRIPA